MFVTFSVYLDCCFSLQKIVLKYQFQSIVTITRQLFRVQGFVCQVFFCCFGFFCLFLTSDYAHLESAPKGGSLNQDTEGNQREKKISLNGKEVPCLLFHPLPHSIMFKMFSVLESKLQAVVLGRRQKPHKFLFGKFIP